MNNELLSKNKNYGGTNFSEDYSYKDKITSETVYLQKSHHKLDSCFHYYKKHYAPNCIIYLRLFILFLNSLPTICNVNLPNL